jgi:hypothetical protein
MGSDLVFRWRKSSSSGQSGECVELGSAWRSVSAEVAALGAVRDSKNPAGPTLRVNLGPLISFVIRN